MLKSAPLFSSLTRPQLMAGAERKAVILLGGITAMMILVPSNIVCAGFGVFLFLIGLPILRLMAKNDPVLFETYIRHIKFKKFYSAHSTHDCQF